jgi:glycosyltransferase involved in cell wall biosynthesis
MKILWLAHEKNLSGANICLLEYLEIMADTGADNFIIVPSSGGMEQKTREKFSHVEEVKFYNWMWAMNETVPIKNKIRRWIRNRKAVKEITALINKYNPDYVVTNTVTTPVAARAAKRSGKKHIWFVHEFGEEDHGYTLAGSFKRAATTINKLSYKVVFNSNATKKIYEPFVPADKRYIVHNAMLMPPGSSFKNHIGKLKLVMLGQVNASKNQLDALRALKECIVKGVDAELNIAGKAEGDLYMNILREFIERNNLAQHVNFLGAIDNPETLLAESELLLMCSRMEAFGRVTVEAMKYGIPVIAANTGGSLELVKENVNGYFYEAGNYKDLAKKIILYTQNKNRFNREKIAEDANNTFNFSNTKEQLLTVFS